MVPPYRRRSLLARFGFEVMLSHWQARGVTAEHDHGGGFGVVFVLHGDATEHRGCRAQRFGPGGVMVCKRNTMHRVEAGLDGATMLHIYVGVRRGMRMRDDVGGLIEVPADHGAWLPR